MRLKNKIAIITGSASGFGKGIAKKFSEEGAKLILVDINSKLLKKVSNSLSQDYFVADVSKSSDFKSLKNFAHKKYGNIDIIVNNAGVTHKPKFMESVNEKDFNKVFNINAKSVYYCAKYFLPKMKKNRKGVILNVASTAGISPRPKLNWYNASKGWMITATKAMAIELATFNVRVNAIAPGEIETSMVTPRSKKLLTEKIPMKRFGTPDEVAGVIHSMCSDTFSYVNGTEIQINGGQTV